jgi:hypothetical protein
MIRLETIPANVAISNIMVNLHEWLIMELTVGGLPETKLNIRSHDRDFLSQSGDR